MNAAKQAIQKALDEQAQKFKEQKESKTHSTSRSRRKPKVGHKHPVSLVMDAAVAIFRRMGFIVADGPDIDTVRITSTHSTRHLTTLQDHLKTNSTSISNEVTTTLTEHATAQIPNLRRPNQNDDGAKTRQNHRPGRRRDTPDATHGMSFHQIEGLYVDKNVSLADLKGVLAPSQGNVRRQDQNPFPPTSLPVHRTFGRSRRILLHLRRRRLPDLAKDLDGLKSVAPNRQSSRVRKCRIRPRRSLRLRLRTGHRATRHDPLLHQRPQAPLRQRHQIPPSILTRNRQPSSFPPVSQPAPGGAYPTTSGTSKRDASHINNE